MDDDLERQAERYAVLEDGQRRAIYRYVRAAHRPVTREEVANGTGVSRSLAAFHLERLLDAGLLTAAAAHPPGRGGPGAGRPAKRYAPSDAEISLEIPPRRYSLAGRLMARAIDGGGSPRSVRDEAVRLAAEEGLRHGRDAAGKGPKGRRAAPLAELTDCLEALGFEPVLDDSGELVLANCPFHELAEAAPELVCGMNASLIGGVLEGLGVDGLQARLAPQPGRCCVVVS